jgi:hypothetical protein
MSGIFSNAGLTQRGEHIQYTSTREEHQNGGEFLSSPIAEPLCGPGGSSLWWNAFLANTVNAFLVNDTAKYIFCIHFLELYFLYLLF